MYYLMEAEYFSSHPAYSGKIVEAKVVKKHTSVLFGDMFEFITEEIPQTTERVLLTPHAMKTLIQIG